MWIRSTTAPDGVIACIHYYYYYFNNTSDYDLIFLGKEQMISTIERQPFFSLSLLLDRVEPRIVRDCREAAEWAQENQHVFFNMVDLPDALKMGEELADAAQLSGNPLVKRTSEGVV